MKPSYRRYSWLLLGVVIAQSILIALLNFAVDPYGVMKSPIRVGFNHLKIEKDKQVRMFKAIDVIRFQPQTILLGFSRTEFGLDPSHPAIAETSAYNLGLPGANMYEVRRYFEHALFVQPNLKRVILDIDLFMFSSLEPNKPDFWEDRLEKNSITGGDIINNLFSVNSSFGSFNTISISRQRPQVKDGFFYENGLRDATFYKKNVYYSLNSKYIFNLFLKDRPFLLDKNIVDKLTLSSDFLKDLEILTKTSQERGIEIKVFISPVHVTQEEALRLAGLDPIIEDWKREVVKITPVWDFSGYNSITSEPITEDMSYYLDSSHYLPSVGNLVMNKILNHNSETVPEDFGVLINSENIETHLVNLRAEREDWAGNNPEVVNYVKNLINRREE
jgi:hypothetical protein